MSCVSHSGLFRVRRLRRRRIMGGDRASDAEHSRGSESTMQLKTMRGRISRTGIIELLKEAQKKIRKIPPKESGDLTHVVPNLPRQAGRRGLWVTHVLRVTFGAVLCPLFEEVADHGR
ncbi:hypothetical protein CDAR_49681 [Caerostris darwini]|uniref:Uncharacterized protein n=1 Tax=Caerostris darwini TaxID=1538125 RepID=A0AAV4T5G3_9ARAC|nr:hypothetical protein CDAR_49681 [Caerostris darwini]